MKIKKIIIAVLLSSMMLTFSACGKSIPEGMSEEVYDYGVKALDIMDKYNDMEISVDDADSRLKAIYDKIDNMDLNDKPKSGEVWSEDEQANMIKSSIVSYNHTLYCIKYEKDNNSSDIYETADKLRETLGMEK